MRVFHNWLNVAVTGLRDTVKNGELPGRRDLLVSISSGRRDLSRKCHSTVARGPVPREFPVDLCMARDRPSPYGEGCRFSPKNPSRYRSAGACPPRSFGSPRHGEGQALALR